MIITRALVLDANILLRAVMGRRVVDILEKYAKTAKFYSPDVCFADARRYIPTVATLRMGLEEAMKVLEEIQKLVETVERHVYQDFEKAGRERIFARDPDDWPVVATALFLRCPIWTEDKDFFGSGIATWTTDRVELFLSEE